MTQNGKEYYCDAKEVGSLSLQELAELKTLYIKCRLTSNFHSNMLSTKATQHTCSPEIYVAMKFDRMLNKWRKESIIIRGLMGDKTIAFVVAEMNEDRVFLARACVEPGLQSQGVAKNIFGVLRLCFPTSVLWAYVHNNNNLGFKVWQMLGFQKASAKEINVPEHPNGNSSVLCIKPNVSKL